MNIWTSDQILSFPWSRKNVQASKAGAEFSIRFSDLLTISLKPEDIQIKAAVHNVFPFK